MTIGELKKYISKYDDDTEVCLSALKDSRFKEENKFHKIEYIGDTTVRKCFDYEDFDYVESIENRIDDFTIVFIE